MRAVTRRALSTGEIAAASDLSQQTVIRCIDRGDLKGYRVPGSKWRRATRAAVEAWARRHGIDLDWSRIDTTREGAA